MKRPSSSVIGWSAALLSTLSFSIAAPIGTGLINLGLSPTIILLVRFWIGVVLLFGTLALTAPDKLRLPRSAWPPVIVAGLAIGVAALPRFLCLNPLPPPIT